MVDIFLHRYDKNAESTSAYNAAHKYRFFKKLKKDTMQFESSWHRGKAKVLGQLVDSIKSHFNTEIPFAFAIAPSNTTIFVNDIEAAVISSFPNAINVSECFSKINGFDAGATGEVLSEEQLRNSITLNQECFNSRITDEISTILLLDDVYAKGNTFNAMKLVINDISIEKEIITASILTTT
jgi:hypothetical protein